MSLYLQTALSSALTGGLYGLMAIGLSLSWGLLRLANIAYFGMIALAAYVTYSLSQNHGFDPLLTVAVTIPLFFLVAVTIQTLFTRFALVGFQGMVATFGLYTAIVAIIQLIWTADYRQIDAAHNSYLLSSWFIGRYALRLPLVIAFALSTATVIALEFTLRRTRFGKAMRAIGHDRQIAGAFGVSYARIAALIAGIVGGTAAISGTLVSMSTSISPNIAFAWFGTVFVAVVIGGPGNVLFVFIAAIVLTVLSDLAGLVFNDLGYAPLVTFVLLLAMLLIRPQGLSKVISE
ncbi:MAG TPA: branched-chain amino acid ABC transporter permease [Gemmatimonadaceae bacterium]